MKAGNPVRFVHDHVASDEAVEFEVLGASSLCDSTIGRFGEIESVISSDSYMSAAPPIERRAFIGFRVEPNAGFIACDESWLLRRAIDRHS